MPQRHKPSPNGDCLPYISRSGNTQIPKVLPCQLLILHCSRSAMEDTLPYSLTSYRRCDKTQHRSRRNRSSIHQHMFFESSWLIVSRFGRRQIFLAGFSIMITCLLLIGNLAPVTPTEGTKWAQPVLSLIWLGSYSASVGPVAYPFRCRQERHP